MQSNTQSLIETRASSLFLACLFSSLMFFASLALLLFDFVLAPLKDLFAVKRGHLAPPWKVPKSPQGLPSVRSSSKKFEDAAPKTLLGVGRLQRSSQRATRSCLERVFARKKNARNSCKSLVSEI